VTDINNIFDMGISGSTDFTYQHNEKELGPSIVVGGNYAAGSVPNYENNDIITISLPYGQRVVGRVINPRTMAEPDKYRFTFEVLSEQSLFVKSSPSKDVRFMTMTWEQYERWLDGIDLTVIDYVPKVRISNDPHGRYGWDSHSIIAWAAMQMSAQIQGVWINTHNYWLKDFQISYGSSYYSAMLGLVGIFDPRIEFDGYNLYILDRAVNNGEFGTVSVVKSEFISQEEPWSSKPKYVRVLGQDSEWRATKYKGKVGGSLTFINVPMYDLTVKAGYSHGTPALEVKKTDTTEPVKNEESENIIVADGDDTETIYTRTVEINYYLRDVFGNKAEIYLSEKFVYKRIGDYPPWPSYTAGSTYTDPTNMETDYLYESKIVIHSYSGTGTNYEKPRLTSTHNSGLNYWGSLAVQPHTVIINGQYCWESYASETGYGLSVSKKQTYYPLASVTFKGTSYTDEYKDMSTDLVLDGVPFYDREITYAPTISDGKIDDLGIFLQIMPKYAIQGKNFPLNAYEFPTKDTGLDADMPISASNLKTADLIRDECIVSMKETTLTNIDFRHYTKRVRHKERNVRDGLIHFVENSTKHISSPPPQEPYRMRTMQAYAEDDTILTETLNNPPAEVGTEAVDWYDLEEMQRKVKNRLRRGVLRRKYRFSCHVPFEIGQSVTLSTYSGPGGAIVHEPGTYKDARVVDIKINRDAKTGKAYTDVVVECDVV